MLMVGGDSSEGLVLKVLALLRRISYHDDTNDDLKPEVCNEIACTTPTLTTVDSEGDVGRYASMALDSRCFPLTSYYDYYPDNNLKVASYHYTQAGQLVSVGSDGWNMISSYLTSNPSAMSSIFPAAHDETLFCKDGEGRVYWPAFDVNQIGDMQPGEGYQIYLNDACNLSYPQN